MILLSLGTHQQPFSRSLDLVEPLALSGERLVIQHGSTPPRPSMPNATWIEFMPYQEMMETMRAADSVVCHAGVGTIITALKMGHVPVVLPRLARHGEHVDDHQLDIAARFAERGLIGCLAADGDLMAMLASRSDRSNALLGRGSEPLRQAVSEAVAVRRPRLSLRPR